MTPETAEKIVALWAAKLIKDLDPEHVRVVGAQVATEEVTRRLVGMFKQLTGQVPLVKVP